MAEIDDMTDEQLDSLPEGLRAEVRKNRQYRQDAEAANKRAEAAEREAAFAKAGVPDSPLAQALAKTYEGENDPASVKAYFEGLGVDLSGKAQEQGTNDADLEAQRRLAQVGSQGDQGGSVRFEDAIGSAKNVDEVMALIASAPEGATDYEGRRIGSPRIE